MHPVLALDAARLSSLATGRGGLPTGDEWIVVLPLVAVFVLLAARMLWSVGLSRVEAALLAAGAPALVLVDAPLGQISPHMALAANLTGCVLPLAIGAWMLCHRRFPGLELAVLVGVAILAAFLSSRVVPNRGVMLQYRVPALVIGGLAAILLRHAPRLAGAAGFLAGSVGVLAGADLLHLRELADVGAPGRVILGGAGMLDGIVLVSVLSAGVAFVIATGFQSMTKPRGKPSGAG